MKFVCSQSDLNSQLSLVGRAVPSRPTHPILGNVLLTADANRHQIQLTAFDLSLGIRTSFPAQVIEGGTLTLPAKLLNDIVSRLPEGEVTLSCPSDTLMKGDAQATLTAATGRFQIRGMGAEEFPELPTIQDGKKLMLPAIALSEGLGGVLFAASPDETKQVLTGVHLTHHQDCLEFAATDGHRLALVETSDQVSPEPESSETGKLPTSTLEDFALTIPARALRELERMLTTANEADLIALHLDDSQVIFEVNHQRLTSRKLDGAYPAYHQLIPRQFSRDVTLERRALISSIERVAVLADQKNNIVKFRLNSAEQKLHLAVEAQDVGSGEEALPAQVSGTDLEIAFNVRYLIDGLKALPSNEIKMQLNENNQPVIFTPLGAVQMTYLIMPVQIRS
ncbi:MULTISPECIES: DNA polymerase III subunit beta [Cyanophyceae]|uniref:DNA polymerase III subunit beta n=1 Tax=Cyanophyceae TaxID=3028117 RepID=UPI0004AACA0D|nr:MULTISPECIES: DNA polymerase III subunit beta [Cyanophyceae]AMA08990.1 DNA polymerase III subunit beta [Picosynechococcus sp. PCC 73109]ANV87135.1 DNA polymerase III subunit beta [Picosynechococcus sp. PCC 7117]ANV90283.1 DNA polymerase III subunit beta [Picosynechococcus sp. PCC 8807]QCS49834.1 DNA polymerase III subunit beta [Picosynechococcus sp. PCC 11901]